MLVLMLAIVLTIALTCMLAAAIGAINRAQTKYDDRRAQQTRRQLAERRKSGLL